jgi:hypothetical protein
LIASSTGCACIALARSLSPLLFLLFLSFIAHQTFHPFSLSRSVRSLFICFGVVHSREISLHLIARSSIQYPLFIQFVISLLLSCIQCMCPLLVLSQAPL